jgi:2-dehydropantoate 2-reductase
MAARICVAGVGAVGGTVAARLAASGESVSLLARGERLERLRRDGLRVEFGDRPFAAHLPVSDSPEFGVQDIVFVATKAHALPALLPTLAPLLGPQTLVAPLVNGIPWWYFQGTLGAFANDTVKAVDRQGLLRDSLAAERIVGCVVYFTAQLKPSGVVSTMGGQRLRIGEISEIRDPPSDRVRDLGSLLSRAGIDTEVTVRIREELWTKVALNLATNPLSVVTESTLVEQFTDPKLTPIVTAVIEETQRVAAAYDIRPTMTMEEMMATGRGAGAFDTSMLQDYRAGRPLELDAIGGTVLELARKIGEDMPTTKLVIALCAHRAGKRGHPLP